MTEAAYPSFATPAEWNAWLAANAGVAEVWVLFHRKSSGVPSITWEQAVIEALAHGWIDGIKKTASDTTWIQRFTPRRRGSIWSLKNTQHIEKLIADGRMTAAGMAQVEIARANGRWDAAYTVSAKAEFPADFLAAVAGDPAAAANFAQLNARNRTAMQFRLTTAKRPETRAKRMAEYLDLLRAGKNLI